MLVTWGFRCWYCMTFASHNKADILPMWLMILTHSLSHSLWNMFENIIYRTQLFIEYTLDQYRHKIEHSLCKPSSLCEPKCTSHYFHLIDALYLISPKRKPQGPFTVTWRSDCVLQLYASVFQTESKRKTELLIHEINE